jgi:signal transduction histidine kinase
MVSHVAIAGTHAAGRQLLARIALLLSALTLFWISLLTLTRLPPPDDVLILDTLTTEADGRKSVRQLPHDWLAADPGPEKMLHILRIVQEAISNTLKHAGATTICVRTGVSGRRGFIEISDDGCGLQTQNCAGHGLINIQTRATRIGAELQLSSSDSGTSVKLLLDVITPDNPDQNNT